MEGKLQNTNKHTLTLPPSPLIIPTAGCWPTPSTLPLGLHRWRCWFFVACNRKPFFSSSQGRPTNLLLWFVFQKKKTSTTIAHTLGIHQWRQWARPNTSVVSIMKTKPKNLFSDAKVRTKEFLLCFSLDSSVSILRQKQWRQVLHFASTCFALVTLVTCVGRISPLKCKQRAKTGYERVWRATTNYYLPLPTYVPAERHNWNLAPLKCAPWPHP